jgi:hydroxymethylpyrimidine pyrophosphatase-like HAD family hydrolase
MIRLVILDVEGVITLPGGSQEPWPLAEMVTLRETLRRAPYACALCTGRQEPHGEAMVQALDLFRPLPPEIQERVHQRSGERLLSWPSVLENGAFFYDPLSKRPVPHPGLTPEKIQTIRRLKTEVLPELVARTGALLEVGKEFCLSLNPPLRWPQTGERIPTAEFRPVVEAAVAGFAEQVEIRHSASAIDITPVGISKASAMQLLPGWTGLAPNEVLGVGDTGADAEWLHAVGVRAAPANGRAALPGMDYYAEHPVIAGLLEILNRLTQRNYEEL